VKTSRLTRFQLIYAAISDARWQRPWTLVLLAIALFAGPQQAHSQTFDLVYTFTNSANGSGPNGELVQDPDGNFYGTTRSGTGSSMFGTIFKLDTFGVETVLYSFHNGKDGSVPSGGLFRDSDGNLYGVARFGGGAACKCGTIFRLTPDNVITTLHSFSGGSDGAFPQNTRLVSVNGVLYGTTSAGGESGAGVIFSVTKAGKEEVVYTFAGQADGGIPNDLVRDSAGNLYGTTFDSFPGRGTIFKVDTSLHFSTLYTFTGGTDGGSPQGRLIIDTNGVIHGTAITGGDPNCNCGVVFRLNTVGSQKVLKTFHTGTGGRSPENGLVDIGGILYGSTALGGDADCNGGRGCGTIFSIGKTGVYSVLHTFTDNTAVVGEMTLGQDGSLFGSLTATANGGSIFKFTP
jgi:uncharacterized repeat protein (TIGR03803 family)